MPSLSPQLVLQGLALTTLGGLSLSALSWAWGGWRRVRHTERLSELELRRFELELEAARGRAEREALRQAWQGPRAFRVRSKRVEDELGRVVSFALTPHDEGRLPEFLPGQYVTLNLQRPGEPRPLRRCYSLSGAPGRDHLRITVKRVDEGRGSGFLHERIQEGDLLEVGPPAGEFHLDLESSAPVVLIAGGVGVTPFLSMLEALSERQPERPAWLFYGVQQGACLIQRARLEELAQGARQVHFCYSQAGERERALAASASGNVAHHCRRIEVEWLLSQLPAHLAGQGEFYTCGPDALMDEVREELLRRGVEPERFHLEAFGGKPRSKHSRTIASPTCQVELKRSGRTLTWTGEHADLLSLLEAEGVESVQAGCWRGNCHSCKTALLAGEVGWTEDDVREPERGAVLPCVCVPRGDVVLDA